MGGIRGKLEKVLAAGVRWSERMNRDADSRTQLSAGSQREREREIDSHPERKRGGGVTDREVVPDSSWSHSVYTVIQMKVSSSFSCFLVRWPLYLVFITF